MCEALNASTSTFTFNFNDRCAIVTDSIVQFSILHFLVFDNASDREGDEGVLAKIR